MQSDISDWNVQHCGADYIIRYDHDRKYLQPKWFVGRVNDLRRSTRWYSFPNGAFTALSSGSVIWH